MPRFNGVVKSSRTWIVLDCNTSLTNYYRHLYHRSVYFCNKLEPPKYGAHVTIIRQELPGVNYHLFNKFDGQRIEFTYHPDLANNNSKYWWLPVTCPRLDEIRSFFGLGPPLFPYHITYGVKTGLLQ